MRSPRSRAPWGLLIVGAVVLVGLGYLTVTTIQRVRSVAGEADSIPTLSELDQQTFDSLMVEATTRFERAATLLEFGANKEAADQLAEALVLLKSSTISDNKWFIPAINLFNNAAIELYQSNGQSRPSGMQKVKNSFKDLSAALGSKLTPQMFALAVDEAQLAHLVAVACRIEAGFPVRGHGGELQPADVRRTVKCDARRGRRHRSTGGNAGQHKPAGREEEQRLHEKGSSPFDRERDRSPLKRRVNSM